MHEKLFITELTFFFEPIHTSPYLKKSLNSMLTSIREIISLLTIAQKRQFYHLQFLVVLMAFFELVGVASVAPFMALVGDADLLDGDGFLAAIYETSGMKSKDSFTFFLGVCVLLMLSVSALVSIFTTWRISLFATHSGTEMADRLYQLYLKKDWMFHASENSAQLTKQIANETQRVTTAILMPLMQMNAKGVMAVFLMVAMSIYNPYVALVGFLLFGVAYVFLYKLVRTKLRTNGTMISDMYSVRYRLMNEGFGGIKQILLSGRDSDFLAEFSSSGDKYARALGVNSALQTAPRHLMELVAFGSIIALVLYLFRFHGGALSTMLPVLSVYALAGFKLLPALQQVYSGLVSIRGNISAFEAIKNDLIQARDMQYINDGSLHEGIGLNSDICLKGVTFRYPNAADLALCDIDIRIQARTTVGFVGASGSGKSTLIDLLLGLMPPSSGQLAVDNTIINKNNLRSWQDLLGFVPQSIFLSDSSISENIAFGLQEKDIELNKVDRAIMLAHLSDFVRGLPNGVETKVGERGVQLSGGQRQRIGIARALYDAPEVLVFDEATSALDGISEKVIMDAINDFSGDKTIILVAHRLNTVKACDQIFFMDAGRIVDRGTYGELLERNSRFKEMAEHA